MIILSNVGDIFKKVPNIREKYSPEMIKDIEKYCEILDYNYCRDRKVFSDDGGFCVLMETPEDYKPESTKKIMLYGDFKNTIWEFVEEAADYYRLLVLYSDDFGVVFFCPKDSMDDEIREYLEQREG
jgi:hypothetical protein